MHTRLASLLLDLPPQQQLTFSLLQFIKEFGAWQEESPDRLCDISAILVQAFPEASSLHAAAWDVRYAFALKKKVEKRLLRKLFQLFSQLLLSLRLNETVIHRLLKERTGINQLVGPRSVEELLFRLFPKGLSDLETATCNALLARHFPHAADEVATLLKEVRWIPPTKR